MRRAMLMVWLGSMMAIGAAASALGASPDETMRASKPEVKKAIVAVIEAQLAALRKGDRATAHGYASAELRAQKPVGTFVEIVRASYPEIWANVRAEFGIVRDDGAKATVTVQVYSKNGDAGYDYLLVKEKAGWRIHGVVRHEAKGSKV